MIVIELKPEPCDRDTFGNVVKLLTASGLPEQVEQSMWMFPPERRRFALSVRDVFKALDVFLHGTLTGAVVFQDFGPPNEDDV